MLYVLQDERMAGSLCEAAVNRLQRLMPERENKEDENPMLLWPVSEPSAPRAPAILIKVTNSMPPPTPV